MGPAQVSSSTWLRPTGRSSRKRGSDTSMGWICARRDDLPAVASAQPRRRSIWRYRRPDMTVRGRLAAVRERIERAGRDPSEVAIVAVTKGFSAEACLQALEAGLHMLGENRVQEALEKMEAVPDAEWHLIGHLQTNKVKQAAGRFALIQSVDSVRLAGEIARAAPAQ